MRKTIMISMTIIILALLNYGIYEKELIRKNGETVLLELRPVDPRSLLQGDYMRLRYKIERGEHTKKLTNAQNRGIMVVKPDENNVAQFVRFHNGEPLEGREKLLPYYARYRNAYIRPDTFLFQEGHRKIYEQAKYGIFKFDGTSKKLLVGLADKDRKKISPETHKK